MPYIKQDFIDRLLQDSDILDVFQRFGDEPQRKGVNYFCTSPFNAEKTPSCLISQKTQRFKDFSSGKFGDVISYLMQKKTISYPEAIEELAKLQGKSIEYENPEIAEKIQEKQKKNAELRKYLEALVLKFQEELRKLPPGHPAWLELEKRKYNSEDIEEWKIGFAPGNGFIYNLFKDAGNVEAGKKLGLINDKNQDKLWNKLIYPIFDDRDKITGFATRNLDEISDFAKWMNPPENELYQKEKILFGLNIAKNAIVKQNRVWIVEGYNDVISFHKFGIENTVSVSGTALSEVQIQMLKKLTAKITLCFDGDSAGKRAISKYVPILISKGFSVEVCQLPETDPDDFTRQNAENINENVSLESSLQPFIISGFNVLLLEKLQGDELDKSNGIKEIIKVISKIPDISLQNIYKEKLIKESKTKQAFINQLIKEQESENIRKINTENETYIFPNNITTPQDQLIPIIEKYQLFVSDNQIFVLENLGSPPYFFKSISNFSLEILQHMNDEKYPAKLLRICNIKGEERIFDAPADSLAAPLEFKKLCARQGNYQWNGNIKELDKLTAYLYDKMGVGRKVDVLGWNTEGFYCWNNSVTIPENPNIEIDKNGIFHYDNHTYYVPSANEIYRNNPTKFAQQKRIVLKNSTHSLEEYLDMIMKVHGDFGIIGILFAFACAHQDIVVDVAKGFPIYFLFGPPSTGKDELFGCIKKMFGISKTDFINLENKQSTGKAKLRSFGEFSNMVVHLSEYTNGDKEIDGMLKGLWDRGSYKRATIDSAVSTDSFPILSAGIVTGNQSPTDEAVLTRLIFGEMMKNQFTPEEKQNFEKLSLMTNDEVTGYMQKVIWHRKLFEAKFSDKFNMYKKNLSLRESFRGAIDRIITNYSILGATHEILRETNDIIFPFTPNEMLAVFDKFVQNLRLKLDSANVLTKFWDVFVWCLRGNETMKLVLDRDIKIEGNLLYIRFTEVFNRIQPEWFPRFGESCQNKTTIAEKLKTSSYWIEETKSTRFGSSVNTSAYVLNLDKIPNSEEIRFATEWQRITEYEKNTGVGTLYESPATPYNNSSESKNDDDFVF
ncbi:MAG: DNA primase [Flavobacteriaceae bacterium]|jgi:DNA primase catalytic core|nr:DNA primase [Flavobacteriaceae bacterium]